jgi:hypothetical protein
MLRSAEVRLADRGLVQLGSEALALGGRLPGLESSGRLDLATKGVSKSKWKRLWSDGRTVSGLTSARTAKAIETLKRQDAFAEFFA